MKAVVGCQHPNIKMPKWKFRSKVTYFHSNNLFGADNTFNNIHQNTTSDNRSSASNCRKRIGGECCTGSTCFWRKKRIGNILLYKDRMSLLLSIKQDNGPQKGTVTLQRLTLNKINGEWDVRMSICFACCKAAHSSIILSFPERAAVTQKIMMKQQNSSVEYFTNIRAQKDQGVTITNVAYRGNCLTWLNRSDVCSSHW